MQVYTFNHIDENQEFFCFLFAYLFGWLVVFSHSVGSVDCHCMSKLLTLFDRRLLKGIRKKRCFTPKIS